jgi:hypothetical protein
VFAVFSGTTVGSTSTTSPAAVGDPNFSQVSLLLHGDDFTDSSRLNASLTNTGSVVINTGVKQFGTGSLSFNATTNSYLTTPSSANYSFGSGDFTIEFWLYITNIANQPRIVGNSTGTWATKNWSFFVNSPSTIGFTLFDSNWAISSSVSIANNTWYHVAFSRKSNMGYMSVNGIVNSLALTIAVDAGTNYMNIGWNGVSVDNKLNGYLDDFRVTKGVARYTANFLVPQFPFPDNIGPAVVEYPPAALTGESTPISGQAYGNGTYVASASSFGSGLEACKSFNKVVSSVGADWSASAVRYSLTDGAWNSGTTFQTTISSTVYNGEWISLQFPVARIVSSYVIQAINYTSGNYYLTTPYSWVLGGSNDGTTWTLVDSRSSVAYSSYLQQQTFTCSAPASYLYYRLVATYIQPAAPDGVIRIGEWRLFGLPGPNGDSNYNNVTLLLHAEGTVGTISSVTDNSPSPKTFTILGTASQSQYSSTQKKFGATAFYFLGYTTQNNNIRFNNVPGFGTGNFTIEFWMYIDEPNFSNQRRIMGNTGGGFTFEIGWNSNGQPFINTLVGLCLLADVPVQTWVYITFVKSGSNILGFVNGILKTTTGLSGTTIDADGSYDVNIGGSGYTNVPQAAFVGYLDEIRITKGVARYTTNFLVPQFPFPDNIGPDVVEYPPAALTGESTTLSGQSYGNGTYGTATSSIAGGGWEAWRAFDKSESANNGLSWNSDWGKYNASGIYIGNVSTGLIAGEYLEITLPNPIVLKTYILFARATAEDQAPSKWFIMGYNGLSWVIIDSQEPGLSASSWSTTRSRTFENTTNTTTYRTYRLVINKNCGSGYTSLAEWRLFGNPASGSQPSLYDFTTFTFTNATQTGATGPTLSQLRGNAGYSAQSWTQDTTNNYLNMTTQGIQLWTVPRTGTYQVIAAGAGNGNATTGRGVIVSAEYTLTYGQIIKILVGQQSTNQICGAGGTFIVTNTNSPILVAGGGGGIYINTTYNSDAVVTRNGVNGLNATPSGSPGGPNGMGGTNGGAGLRSGFNQSGGGEGGAGFSEDALGVDPNHPPAKSFINGGTGSRAGITANGGFVGGFGCGGSCYNNFGAAFDRPGGGGYSGGGAGTGGHGGGGGSYDMNNAATATRYTTTINGQTNGFNTGHGFVRVTFVS